MNIGRPPAARVIAVLWRRDLVRMFRQPVRIAAAVGTPALLWLVLAGGLSGSIPAAGPGGHGNGYAMFLLPGMMTLAGMFSAVFSSISIIEDRREGWLQAALASPAPRWSIALGRIAGGASVAWLQAALLLPAAWIIGPGLSTASAAMTLAALALTCLALAAVGATIAWRCETVAGFHAAMNLLFMPLWMLSGAFFPPEGASPAMTWLLMFSPLAWCTEAIRAPLAGASWGWSMVLAMGFTAAMIGAAAWISNRPENRSALRFSVDHQVLMNGTK
jgi:ABC-2 type transport system permease protein